MKYAQSRLDQDDIGCITRDISRAVRRNSDVGWMQRGRIVYTVAYVANYVTTVLEGKNDAVLLCRRDARKYSCLFTTCCKAESVIRSISSPKTAADVSIPTCSQIWGPAAPLEQAGATMLR